MTENARLSVPAGEGDEAKETHLGLGDLAFAAAQLLQQTIKNTDPGSLDFKDVKQLTGALKDLAELMEEGRGGEDGGGIIIRIEGDPTL